MMAALRAEPYGKETEIRWRKRGYAIHLDVLAIQPQSGATTAKTLQRALQLRKKHLRMGLASMSSPRSSSRYFCLPITTNSTLSTTYYSNYSNFYHTYAVLSTSSTKSLSTVAIEYP
jgi:hypothetical protein